MSARLSFAALIGWALITSAVAGEAFMSLDRAQAKVLSDPARHTTPTIIALWSTECPHCKKNLGLFAEMAKTDTRLELITVATEPLSADVVTSLNRINVPGRRYAYGTDAPEAIAYSLDPKWHGELPRTLIFDGRGNRAAISGTLDAATLRKSLGLSIAYSPP
jgi:hypothetical protein